MGHVNVTIRISNPADPARFVDVDALVDTGATLTTIPREMANHLDLPIRGQNSVRTASGIEVVDRSSAWIEIEGKDGFIQVSVSDSYPGVLVGVLTLETLGFAVDPVGQRLIDSELLLL